MNVRSVEELVACLQRDEPVLLPTDTVPALAIRPHAAARIWELKQRPAHKPLILMGAEPEPEIDWGHCETDAECAALWGDDGGPEPYRLWWTLKMVLGFETRLLDGGLQAWKAAGLRSAP